MSKDSATTYSLQDFERLLEENERLRQKDAKRASDLQRLARQLEAANEEAARREPWMAGVQKGGDPDNEETPLPKRSAAAFAKHGPSPKKDPGATEDASPLKRKRSEKADINDDLQFLKQSKFPAPSGPRRKKGVTRAESDSSEAEQVFIFDFKAITEWHDDAPEGFDSSSYLTVDDIKKCDFLVDRIRQTVEIWEGNCGSEWQMDFRKPSGRVCVTSKTAKRTPKWRHGDKEGRYACTDCVMNGRPCFRVLGTGEFELLPLHEDDRTHKLVPGKTDVRYWVNDHTEFSTVGTGIWGEDDEDYSE